jgi:TetR/AcrR family transcriptional regulator, cholesterol catabolism regulator
MSNSQTDRILDGSGELFLQAGIKSVTMDDIAKHLGMSKKTIYQFFKDKNELVLALVSKRLKDDEKEMSEILSKSGNVIEEMINMMKCSEEIFSRANPIVVHDMQKYHPEAWKVFQQFKAGVIVRTLEELLAKGIKQGYIRPDLDVKVIAKMRMLQVEAGFNAAIFPLTEFNPWKVQRELMDHFNYGICTMKGYKLLNEYKNIREEVN